MAVLAAGGTYDQAAEYAGLSTRTVKRRMAEPGFRDELHRHGQETLDRLRRRTVSLATGALETLRDVAVDRNVPAAARVRACELILARADPLSQAVEVSGPGGGPVEVADASPVDRLRAELARIQARRADLAEAPSATSGVEGNGHRHTNGADQ
jgi:hypothetical protein